MSKWFKDCTTLQELKEQYRKLALQYHPDRPNGNLSLMQEINAEYDRLFPMFQSKSEVKNEQFETATEYKDVINKIIHLNVNIEICGIYVWVSGNTKPVKEVLKQAGFYWASHKMAWYWKPSDYQPKTRKNWSMDTIRDTFGQEVIREAERMRPLAN